MTKNISFLVALMLVTSILQAQNQNKLEVTIQNSHTESFYYQYSQDGRLFVTQSLDGTIKLWNKNGILIRTINPPNIGSTSDLDNAFISPDGSKIVYTTKGKNIYVQSTEGPLLNTYSCKADNFMDAINSPKFTYDGKNIVGYSYEQIVVMNDIGIPEDSIDIKIPNSSYTSFKINSIDVLKNNNVLVSLTLYFQGNVADESWYVEYSLSKGFIKKDTHYYQFDVEKRYGKNLMPKFEIGAPAYLYNIITKEKKNSLGFFLIPKRSATISSDNKYISFIASFGVGNTDRIKLLNLENLEVTDLFKKDNAIIKAMAFNKKSSIPPTGYYGAILVGVDNGRELVLIDKDFKEVAKKTLDNSNASIWDIQKLEFSPDGMYLLGLSHRRSIVIFDLNGNIINTTGLSLYDKSALDAFSYTQNGDFFLAPLQEWEREIYIWNRKGKRIAKIKENDLVSFNECEIISAAITPDGGKILISSNKDFFVINMDKKIVSKTKIDTSILNINSVSGSSVKQIHFAPNGEYAVSVAKGKEIAILYPDGKLKRVLTGHTSEITSLSISTDSKYIVSESEDRTIKLWRVESGDNITILAEDDDWIVYTPDGYFDASKNGGKFVGMTIGSNGFAIDQFALKYNRPDIILKRMGFGTSELIAHYENQYKKRLRKLGLTEGPLSNDFHVPVATIKTTEIKDKTTTLTAALTDDKYNLKRYNIYINDVPLYGTYGKEISGMNTDITANIELTKGNNKIEVSCLNEKGTESYRALTYANYNGEVKGDLYLLAFGVSKYQNPAYNLQFADKDATDLARVVDSLQKIGYENVYTKVLTNEQVTPAAIKASKDFVKNAKPDDTFILFIAGHGMHDKDADATYYYLTNNADINNLKGTAADFETIEDLLQGIPPRNKLFLMDACESGEIDEEDQGQMITTATGVGIASRGFKNTSTQSTINEQRTTKRSYLYQKDRYIYNDLVRRSGAIVFSSSKGGELSYERSDIENGLFTEYIMKALTTTEADKDNNGIVSTDELREYVSTQVAKASGDLQHPTVDRDNIYQKFGFTIK